MTMHTCILTEKGAALKEAQEKKSQKQKSQKNTQAQSATSGSHKNVTKANKGDESSSSSKEDDCCPQKQHCQPDPEEIIEIDDGRDSEQAEEVVNEELVVRDEELDAGDEELDVEGSKGLEVRGEEPHNDNGSDIELLDSLCQLLTMRT